MRGTDTKTDTEKEPPNDRARLVLLSFLMLFVELALIRWTGSNIVYLSYFSNFVLLGSFLGIGVGFLRSQAGDRLFAFAPMLLALLVSFVLQFRVEIDRSGGDIIYFGDFGRTGLPMWLTLPIIFLASAAVMGTIAAGVAHTFVRFPPLEAYRLDIVGSLLGIAGFSLLSLTHAPPVAWGAVATSAFLMLLRANARPLGMLPLPVLLLVLGLESLAPDTSWSPYYKVTRRSTADGSAIHVQANGIPHQAVTSVEVRRASEPIYFLPYELAPSLPLNDVLVVGAGNGTDVAIALSEGAGRVDAVEIDPGLHQLGRELHPDRPYDDERVFPVIDDGRAFLERSDRRYDLILFALPDSLTLVSGQSSLRLESYLFTLEALEQARAHLKPGGVFAMYNFYRERWLIDRLAHTLDLAYGHPPCVQSVGTFGQLALFLASPRAGAVQCPSAWQAETTATGPATDNHPFLYLRERGIPRIYWISMALILAASVAAVRLASGPLRKGIPYLDLFFMGAAFLLLETKSVVQFALLFGTTWFVNALVFSGILLAVLGAVEVSRRSSIRRPARLCSALLGSLALAWAVPAGALLPFGRPVRFGFAILLAFSPIFLANLLFAHRFRDVSSSGIAFGVNLLGAMVGGLLEYSALVVGYRALALIAAALYGLAFVFGRAHLRARVPA